MSGILSLISGRLTKSLCYNHELDEITISGRVEYLFKIMVSGTFNPFQSEVSPTCCSPLFRVRSYTFFLLQGGGNGVWPTLSISAAEHSFPLLGAALYPLEPIRPSCNNARKLSDIS